MNESERAAREDAWDKCIASMRYPDGSPVEIVSNQNPYRKSQDSSKGASNG